MIACAFTGHRRIEERHRVAIDGILVRAINYAYREGCRIFYVGGALGFDTAAAKQIILFRMQHRDVELRVIIPCKTQSEKWSPAQVRLYEYVLANADSVEYVSDEYTTTCMKTRNRKLVDLSDMVIAYVSRDFSGSAQTVRMAEKDGKPVYNLYHALDNELKCKQ